MIRSMSCAIFLVVWGISGCGTPPSKTVANTVTYKSEIMEDTPVCKYERVTGSHLQRKRCFTAAQLKHMREQSKAWLRTGGRSGGPIVVRDAADPRDSD